MSEPIDAKSAPADPLPEVDEPAPAPAPQRVRRGGFLTLLTLLVALGALGGSGYLYYHLIHLDSSGDLAAHLDAAAAERERLQRRIADLEQQLGQQRSALSEFRDAQERARAESEQALRRSLNEVARQGPPTSALWQKAEVQYLLRIANHRLRLERDVAGALSLLRAADAILAELDDFSLFEVRAHLTDEIAALEQVEGIDLQGLFLRLEALKRQADALPLRRPALPAPAAESGDDPAAAGWWPQLVRQISGHVRLRRLEAPIRPLLAPEEAGYLELSLRLTFERAQLAVLRGDELLYQESLAAALAWVEEYLDAERPATRRLRGELLALGEINLDQPLPDVSASLNALRVAARSTE